MKAFMKVAVLVTLALTLMVACSQKSSEQQAAAPKQGQAQPAVPPAAQAPVQAPAVQAQSEQPQTAMAPAEQAVAQPEEISGTIVKTEEGIALFSDAGNFMIAGQEMDALVGKNVKVTGTIDEGTGKPIINVTSVSVIE